MWPKLTLKRVLTLAVVLMISAFVVSTIYAQDAEVPSATPTVEPTTAPTVTAVPTEIPTAVPTALPTIAPTEVVAVALQAVDPTAEPVVPAVVLSVVRSEPATITAGQSATLSVIGANFTASTTVRLVGYGFLNATLVNSGAMTAALPSSLPAGIYYIEISDPANGTATVPTTLTVNAAAVVTTAVPTSTPLPGEPTLVVSNFSANPAAIYPGATTQLTFTVVNVGSRTAQGVVVSLGNTAFTPANGQASITLPDLASGAAYAVTLAAMAPTDASEGPQNIALVLTSRDFSGQTYTNNATVSVVVAAETKGESQVVLDSYQVNPSSAAAGDTVVVQALFKNTGTETAEQVLVQLDATSGVLIAGANGNAFSLGSIPAGSLAPLTMSLVVASDAQTGAQAQAFKVNYLQDGEAKETTSSISLQVASVVDPSPLLLLQSYSTGQDDPLNPDQRFTFEMTLQNAGAVDLSNLLVTFGTVSSSSSSSSSGSSATETATSSTTTTSSESFAIYGSGGTVLVGNLAAGDTASLTQDFIVATGLTSGIHDLPITLQYQTPDGTTSRQSLNASVFVVVPPTIRITNSSTLAATLTAGTEYTLSVKIANQGSTSVALSEMLVSGENATISEGATAVLDPMDADDDTTKTVTFTPDEAGNYSLTVDVDYVDDLNQLRTLSQVFTGEVSEAVVQRRPQRDMTPPTTQQDTSVDLGRLLLGFLGFGG